MTPFRRVCFSQTMYWFRMSMPIGSLKKIWSSGSPAPFAYFSFLKIEAIQALPPRRSEKSLPEVWE
jgi:hypothetical protein